MRSLAWLDPNLREFPNPALALSDPNGLLAIGGDLSPERVLQAYRAGIFPWYEDPQPILWWSPNPRAVLYPDQLHISRSLRRAARSGGFRATLDQRFSEVIQQCGQLRQQREGTWITADMRRAYVELHRLGFAHSVEILRGDQLVGGLYGLALGRVFFGESMFALVANASKIALWLLTLVLAQRGFHFIDCQVESDHLTSLGAVSLPRSHYIDSLQAYAQPPDPVGSWTLTGTLGPLDHLR